MSKEKQVFQDTIALRQKLNYEIVNELYKRIEENPTLRFGQIIADFFPLFLKAMLLKPLL